MAPGHPLTKVDRAAERLIDVSVRASVILCTHNRSELLAEAVRSILRCDVNDDDFEVIVVDNASTDRTAETIRELQDESPGRPLRYLREERLGKYYAQHLGARAARSSLLLYTDDDVEVSSTWIQAYIDAFDAHPETEAAGGPVHPRWEADPPSWLLKYMAHDEYSIVGGECCGPLALMDRGDAFLLGPDGYFFSNNMAVRYDALERFGGFRPGLFGNRKLGASEWGLVEAMHAGGAAIGYIPRALVWHRISAERAQPRFFEQWWNGPAGEMFTRWNGRRRTPPALLAELWRILRSYWRSWLHAALTRRRPEPSAVRIRVRAGRGWCELVYLWRMLTDRKLKAMLDMERFGP